MIIREIFTNKWTIIFHYLCKSLIFVHLQNRKFSTFHQKFAACQSSRTPQAANFLYYRSSQLKVAKSLSLNHLTSRFCKNRRVLRRQTLRRPVQKTASQPDFCEICRERQRTIERKRRAAISTRLPNKAYL